MRIELNIKLRVGLIKFKDVETGFWVLFSEGKEYRVSNMPEVLKKTGLKIATIIEETKNNTSIYMRGEEIKIIEYKLLN